MNQGSRDHRPDPQDVDAHLLDLALEWQFTRGSFAPTSTPTDPADPEGPSRLGDTVKARSHRRSRLMKPLIRAATCGAVVISLAIGVMLAESLGWTQFFRQPDPAPPAPTPSDEPPAQSTSRLAPRHEFSAGSGRAGAVAVNSRSGGRSYLYLGMGDAADRSFITVWDVTVPAAEVRLGEVLLDTEPSSLPIVIHIHGDWMLVSNDRFSVFVLSILNPEAPIVVGSIGFQGRACHGLAVIDDQYFVVGTGWATTGEVRIVDWSDRARPTEVARVDDLRHPGDFFDFQWPRLYMTHGYAEGHPVMSVLDLSRPVSPQIIGTMGGVGGGFVHGAAVFPSLGTMLATSDVGLVEIRLDGQGLPSGQDRTHSTPCRTVLRFGASSAIVLEYVAGGCLQLWAATPKGLEMSERLPPSLGADSRYYSAAFDSGARSLYALESNGTDVLVRSWTLR